MRYAAIGLAAACLTYAQQGDLSDRLLLNIKAKIAENLDRLPNYTCAETTERFRRQTAGSAYERIDTVRLEVALVEGRELFGWPGSNRIMEPDLTKLIGGSGALSNGNFALLARGIFMSSATAFTPRGPTLRGSIRSLRYEYQVPPKASGYRLKVDAEEALVGYHGSFWVDPETLDLLRLEIAADHIPPEFPIAAATDAMEYGRMKIGPSDFLLPARAELTMVTQSGLADRNRTRFHDCHQYAGESVVSFGAPPDLPRVPPPIAPAELVLPDDFQVDIALATPITPSTAIGDVVEARLVRNVREHHRILVTKGATISGRITQLHRDENWFHVGLTFTDLADRTAHADVSGRQNVLLVGSGVRDFRRLSPFDRTQHGFQRPGPMSAGQLAIPSEKPLDLEPGFRFTLRSRLVQSGK